MKLVAYLEYTFELAVVLLLVGPWLTVGFFLTRGITEIITKRKDNE